jgi:hypothetical protein
MARQSGRERRGDQGEKRQPYQHMIVPSPHRRKPLPKVPYCDCRGAAISFRRMRPFIGRRGGAMSGCWVQLAELCSAAIRRFVPILLQESVAAGCEPDSETATSTPTLLRCRTKYALRRC